MSFQFLLSETLRDCSFPLERNHLPTFHDKAVPTLPTGDYKEHLDPFTIDGSDIADSLETVNSPSLFISLLHLSDACILGPITARLPLFSNHSTI